MADDLLDDGKISVAIKRPFAGQQLIQHNARRKQIRAGIHGQTLHLFRRHVFEGADHGALCAGGFARVLNARHAEVCQFDAAVGFDQQVGGLDIAVHDVLPVRIVQCRQQLANHAQRLLQRIKFAAVQMVLQVFALNKLHDQIGHVIVAVRVIHADDVGVLQPGRRTGLGLEARLILHSGVLREVFYLDGLDRYSTVQIRVDRLIHQTHRALAEYANNVISTKLFQTHGWWAPGNVWKHSDFSRYGSCGGPNPLSC